MRKTTKLAAVVGASALVIGTAGAAYAFWTTTGTGTGSATAGNVTQNLTLTASPTSVSALVPGGPAVGLDIAVSNPNSYSVSLASTTAAIVAGSVKCGATVVDDAWFTLGSAGITSTTITGPKVGSTNGTATLTPSGVTLKFNDDTTASQNVCKGAAITFNLTSS